MIESIVITTGKSGSTYLDSVLNSHPSVNSHGEIWSPGTDLGMDRYKAPLMWMKQYYNANSGGKPVQSSKAIVTVFPEVLSTIALDSTVKKIVLIRKNVLGIAVSSWFSNRYNSLNYSSKVSAPEKVDLYFLESELQRLEQQNRDLHNIADIANTHIIYYEDFGLDEFNKVFDFLGVDRFAGLSSREEPERFKVGVANRYDIECAFGKKYQLEDRNSK